MTKLENPLAYLPGPNSPILPIPLIRVESGLRGTLEGRLYPQSKKTPRELATFQKHWGKKLGGGEIKDRRFLKKSADKDGAVSVGSPRSKAASFCCV